MIQLAVVCHPIFAAGSSQALVYSFSHSDLVGQAICIGLFLASVYIWWLMLCLNGGLKKARKENNKFIEKFDGLRNPLSMREQVKELSSPAANVYEAACERIQSFKLEFATGGRRAMTDDELQMVRSAVNIAIEDQLNSLKKDFVKLQIAVSGGPFFGLFGTVWGITVAFGELAQLGRADVQTLAPGIAGALLTTVVGLIVAIPSMIMYNIVLGQHEAIAVQLDRFADNLNAKFKLEQLTSIAKAQGRTGE